MNSWLFDVSRFPIHRTQVAKIGAKCSSKRRWSAEWPRIYHAWLWFFRCVYANVCHSSFTTLQFLPLATAQAHLKVVYSTHKPTVYWWIGKLLEKFICMEKGHRKNDMLKTFQRIQLEFQALWKNCSSDQDADDVVFIAGFGRLLLQTECARRKKNRIQYFSL